MSWTTVYLLPFIKNKILKNIFYIWRHQRYTIRRFRLRYVSAKKLNPGTRGIWLQVGHLLEPSAHA